jgi:hypothetical protein
MKIERPTVPSAAAPVRPRAGASGGFSLSGNGGATTPGGTAPAVAAGGVASVGALLALQEADGPLERRRKAVRRAGRLLDGLEAVKLSLLGGAQAGAALDDLARAAREERFGAEGDERLQGLLDQIEARAAVELAKAEMSRRAA